MSWEEYKAQREGKTQNIQTTSIKSTSSNSWEEYKRKRDEEEKERQRRLQEQNERKTEISNNTLPKASESKSNYRQQLIERIENPSKEEKTGYVNVVMDKDGNMYDIERIGVTELRALGDTKSGKAKYINGKLENFQENNYTSNYKTMPSAKDKKDFIKSGLLKAGSLLLNQKYEDVANVAENLFLGTKKGGMNFIESGVSAINRTQNDYDKIADQLISRTNKVREEKGFEPLPTAEESKKIILGDSYNKDLFGRDKEEQQKKWENKKSEIDEKIVSNIESTDSVVGRKLAELAPSIGQQLPGYVLPNGLGLTYFTGSAKGAYMEDAKARGMSEEDANAYSGIMALGEGFTDIIGAKITKGIGKNIAKGNPKNALKLFGLDIAENFIEEAVMEPISETTATLTGGKETANWDNIGKRMLNSGLDGALSSIIMAGTSAGVGKAVQLTNKMNNNQQVTQQEISEAVKETLESDKVKQEELKEIIKENTNEIIKQEISEIQEQGMTQEQNMIPMETASNEGSYSKQIENNQETKVELDKILNNKDLPMQGYKYEASDNAKINQLRQQASQYFNNSEEAHKFVGMLEKIITDKDIEIRLDANLKTADGRVANGSYSNGVININPNSSRTGEFIAIHELTHAIGTKEMLDMVNTYRQSNGEFDTAVKSLLQNYEGTEITEEALSDVSAQLFGNQEFINNIANTNPGFFKKIYNEIKYLWHQFRGYKNQNQFIEDLYHKWTQAYNSNNKLNGKTNYSIAGRKGIENIRNNHNLYNQAIDNYNLAKNMAKQGENNTEIMKKTGWFKDDTGKLKFLFSDKDMSLKNINFKENEVYTLEQILNHNTLFMFYPELRNYEVLFKDLNKGRKEGQGRLNGAFSRTGKQIRLDINRANFKMNTEGTLIHEIQHAIQNIEGFTRGTSTKAGKRQYQRNLGEREAKDTANRFFNEKYNGIDMSNILPESATFNRNILDKMKDAIYNYFNRFNQGVSNEETNETNQEDYNRNRMLVDGRINDDIVNFNQGVSNEEVGETNQENSKRNRPLVVDGINDAENSNKSSFSMDNQGRTLTKEQQEYFKDSKVRDENGKLLTMYHGSYNNGFTVFDKDYLGTSTNAKSAEMGFFFTDNQGTAKEYAKRSANGALYEVYLDMKNPLVYDFKGKNINADESLTKLLKEAQNDNYDGVIALNIKDGFKVDNQYVVFNSNQIKNIDNTNPTSNPDIRYSQNNESWQQHLDKNFKATGTRTNLKNIGINVAPTAKNNVAPSMVNYEVQRKQKKTMNPTEISNLKLDDASTTPKLEQRNYKAGNKQSSFLSNIITDSKFLNEDLRQEMAKEDNIRYYQGITNEKTLENAYNKLEKNGQSEVIKWHSKDSKNANAEDVAEGWILLKQYQDSGDYQSAVEVAKKMRDIGTTAGQTVQAYNILSRLTPEGMFYYAQAELNEAYNRMVEGKSKKWIEENQSKFDLTPEETQSILDIMQDVATMEDGYDKKVRLAEVQKIITNKIPPTSGQSIKSWMRISMLFNPKTQVRNVMGNAVILPVNMFSDSVSTGIDKLISKKTGVRTTGNTNLKNYGKGFGKGLYESYNDFRKGINTRNIEGNRFEVSEGKNFKDKGIGKALNRVDNLLSFMLDAGDRGFYEATFTNSINNQMILNKTTTPTAEMIEIATNEALQRTWQDNNKYTQSVLKIRKILNNVNVKGYGLGDVIIPFAKTPANLTKAIVDYSPAGLIKTLTIDARKIKNSLENGQFTAKTQHQFVQNLGKATAGTFLYVLGYALAKAGIATGEADEDKDVKNFMKNSLGISSYSIKIGDKSFSYDWAQPIATPLAIMTNFVKYSGENPDANVLEKSINAMNIGTEQLLQQSFMESLNTVLNGNGTTLENLSQAVLELPARAVPTFSKQIADMVDRTQRTTFEYDKPVQSAINSVIAKIPGASKSLPASIDTLGNEIQKYGGNNNIFNVMFNPANTNKGKLSKAGEEIYNVYNQTGDKTIFPRTAPYYINNKGEKVVMDAHQKSDFQTISGKYVENSMNKLLNDSDYKKLDDEAKAEIINEIVSDSYSKAKYDVLKIDSKEYAKLRETFKNVSSVSYYNYKFKTKDMKKDSDKIDILINADYTNKEKTALYEQYIVASNDKKYPIIKETFTENGLNMTKYLKYKNQDFSADRKDDGTIDGKAVYGSGKEKRKEYIENMGITYTQGIILYGLECTPSDKDKRQIVNYIKTISGKTNQEKLEMLSSFEWVTIYKNGSIKY